MARGPGGTADLPPERAGRRRRALLGVASRKLAALTDAPVEALAIAGMGETGVLVDDEAKPAAPAFAWFDPRGAVQVAAFPAEVRDRVRRAHRPPARAAGVRRQARLPARPGPGARRPALAQPARVRRDGARRPGRRRAVARLPHRAARPGHRRAVARDARPRSGSRRTSCRPSSTAGTDLGRIADGLAPSRAPGSPSRATTTSSRPRPTARSPPSATTSRWARPKCCCG